MAQFPSTTSAYGIWSLNEIRNARRGDNWPTGPDSNFANVSLLLHGDGTNGGQNNTFLDSSTNNFTITRNGDVTQGSFSPFSLSGEVYSTSVNGGSGYFDGTGDYLTVASNAAFGYGTGDFTIEFFVYFKSLGTPIFFDQRTADTQDAPVIWYNSGLLYFVDGANKITGGTLSTNTWYHIAVCRSGTSTKMFIDGVQTGLTYTDSTNYITSPITFGARYNAVNNANAYFSGVRIVKGTALYTAAFTPPTSPPTAVTNTELLCNFTNAAIFDNAAKNVLETVGNAQIDTAVKKFGTGSMEFDGTGDWLKAPDNTDLQFGTGDFTVEFWVYLATGDAGSNRGLVAKGGASTGWLVSLNTTEKLVFTYTTSTITSSGSITLDAWNHIAVVREGTGSNETKIYINGTNDGTGTVSTDFTQTDVMYIGANRSAGDPMKGYIDDLRITKGVARYTANFTPPTAPFPDR